MGLLTSAMEEVRAGRSAAALTQLEQHEKSFPDSSLAQERDVLRIEALVKLGRREEAATRVDAFKKRWPTSTHLVRLEALLRQ